MSVSILIGILASNQKEKTLRCLESLRESACQDFEVLLVDNGSAEGIGEAARGLPKVTVSLQRRNTGCAGGRNILLDYFFESGKWPYLFFLDNDTVVPPEALGRLLAAAAERVSRGVQLGALGPYVAYLDRPETLWCAGGCTIDWGTCWITATGQGEPVSPVTRRESQSLDTLSGGFMLVAREAARATGRFIEDYVIYSEDADWCWRMKLLGYGLDAVPGALILHDASSSVGSCSARFHYYRTRNRMWFFQAHSLHGRWHVLRQVVGHVMQDVVRMELGSGHPFPALGALVGLLHGFFVPRTILVHGRGGRE